MTQPPAGNFQSPVSKLPSPVWDGLTSADLADRCGVRTLHLFDATDSTLDVAHELAEQGADSGTVVLADSQRAGRGRMGRSWSSEPSVGVWCTVIERGVPLDAMDVLSIRVGLQIAERLDSLAGEPVGVKWPNDLVVCGAKLGGILVEARWAGDKLGWVAIGVGVNFVSPLDIPGATGLVPAAQRREPKAESPKPKAESLKPRAAGVRRVDALMAIVAGIRAAASAKGHLSPDELKRYGGRDYLKGKRVVEPVVGTVTGIATNGALVVEARERTERVRTGTIRLAEGR